MKFITLFLQLVYFAKCKVESNRNAKIELMFVVSSETRRYLDGTRSHEPGQYAGTKEYFMDIFEDMRSLFGLLDIELILFDFVIQDDDKVFGGEFEDNFSSRDMNSALTVEKLKKHSQYTTRSSQPDARLYFLPYRNFNDEDFGVSNFESVCNDDAFGIVKTGLWPGIHYKHKTALIASHELGHILGAVHSNTHWCLGMAISETVYEGEFENVYYRSETLINFDENGNIQINMTQGLEEEFIMHSSYSQPSGNWSECTRYDLSSDEIRTRTQNSKRPHCIFEELPTKNVLNGPICGNGMIEDGEDCELGLCCSDTCTFLPKGTVCQNSSGESFDSDYFCTGQSTDCSAWSYVDVSYNGKGLDGECAGNVKCSNNGRCFATARNISTIHGGYQLVSLSHCVCDTTTEMLTVTSWFGDDCSQATYVLTKIARLLLCLGLLVLLGFFGLLAFVIRRHWNKKNSTDVEHHGELIKVVTANDQPKNESKTLLSVN